MTSLSRFFFRAPYSATRSREIWHWWESRRPVYNFAVIAAGITTLIIVYLAELLIGGSTGGVPWIGIVIYGILANLFYTLGPIADSFVMRRWGRDYSEVGPTLFRYGFVFAVGLTLLPVPLAGLRVILRIVF